MHRFWSILLIVAIALVSFGPRLPVHASSTPAKKTCKYVIKKVHGKKKRVKVCKTVKPKPTSQPTATRPAATSTSSPSSTPVPTSEPAKLVGPKAYYLALGDSLAYGYQPDLDINHGYADDFYADLKTHGASHFTNLGCPGETTTTFLHGGCPYSLIVKTPYTGSQMSAALQFLRQHAGQVSPVTLDIGANDFSGLTSGNCTTIPNSTAELATFDANFKSILSQLHDALGGKGDLLVMNYYDPVQNSCSDRGFLASIQRLNAHIAADAAQYQAPVADVFAAFGGDTVPNPHICTYTWICSSYHDVHATAQGYAAIAGAFEKTAGY